LNRVSPARCGQNEPAANTGAVIILQTDDDDVIGDIMKDPSLLIYSVVGTTRRKVEEKISGCRSQRTC